MHEAFLFTKKSSKTFVNQKALYLLVQLYHIVSKLIFSSKLNVFHNETKSLQGFAA